MGSKFKWCIIIIICMLLFGWAANFYSRNYIEKLSIAWSDAYKNGDDAKAREIAYKMGYIDNWAKAASLGDLAVTDSIHLNGQAKQAALSGALNRMEGIWYSFPLGADWREFILLKASIAAMLDDKQKATKYAIKACSLHGPMTIDECLIGKYSIHDPYGSRWKAILLYEDKTLYNTIGTGDKTKSTFYLAVALKYFDLNQAHEILNKLTREGRLTPEMHKIYCNPASPADTVVCMKP